MVSSPRAWFDKFSQVVQQIDFHRSAADSSLFIHRRTQGIVILLVYVDDILITGNDCAGISKVKAHLSSHFHTKDLGPLRYFLGIEVARKDGCLLLSQRKYCLDLLDESGFLG